MYQSLEPTFLEKLAAAGLLGVASLSLAAGIYLVRSDKDRTFGIILIVIGIVLLAALLAGPTA